MHDDSVAALGQPQVVQRREVDEPLPRQSECLEAAVVDGPQHCLAHGVVEEVGEVERAVLFRVECVVPSRGRVMREGVREGEGGEGGG